MEGVQTFGDFLGAISSSLPVSYGLFVTLAIFSALIVVYGIFVFYFYKFIAEKNFIKLDLARYNKVNHKGAFRFFAVIFYILEYIILLPLLTFFWFAVLALFFLVLSKTESATTILTLAAAFVVAVRVSSYVSEELSRDMAKIIPFGLLAFFLIEPGFFSLTTLVGRFLEIPVLIGTLPYFLIFIVVVEFIVRILNLSYNFVSSLGKKTGAEETPLEKRERKEKEAAQ